MPQSLPLISCLCVTHKRIFFLKRAITYFSGQTYPEKEMIIVCPEDDHDALNYISGLKDERLVPVTVPANHQLTLGELRNISMQNCNGKYFCQWDDDDWNHPERLSIQYNNLAANHYPATMLTNILMYDAVNEQAYFSNFRLWDQTVMGSTDLCGRLKYKSLKKAEDTEFSTLLMAESKVFPTVSHNLYIYLFHGGNTCDQEHFNFVFRYTQPLSKQASKLIGDIVNNRYSLNEAAELLESEALKQEINYFYYDTKMIREQLGIIQ